FNLARHQNAPLAGGPFDRERRIADIVFGNAASDEPSDQIAGALDQGGIEFGYGEELLEIAAHARIEMHATAVEHQRGCRYEIGAEPDRADKPVLDPDQRDAPLLGCVGEPRRGARGPNGDAASRPAAGCCKRRILGAPKGRSASTRPQKISNLATLPERHSEANRDLPVGGLDFLPLCKDIQNVLERGGFLTVRIEIAGREKASTRKYFVDRPAKRFLWYAGFIRRNAPARIERIGKAADP